MNETLHFESAGAISTDRQERHRQREVAHREELRAAVAAGELTERQA